ncbi:proteoglycan 4 [Engraulis encrasicolus]|uniref:proteoglycan 4 n=1 Tax=Engraulis encrasicolus TaxID=184585 RepID=UPI002FD329A4
MKKGFLGRKNQSLFDTSVQMKDVGVDHYDLVLDAKAIPESGTAKVRSRPTVNYFNSHGSTDAMQGFAVPTPKVPVLLPLNGPTTNGIGSTPHLANGGMIAVDDEEEGEILIPAPPSVAPPPPPPQFIPPSPGFVAPPLSFVDIPPELASLQPPPMPAPKPPTPVQNEDEIDFASLKPPAMPPPKPPSDTSSTNSVKISTPISMPLNDPSDVPECPKFTPPPPPVKQQPSAPPKTLKTPPPKPVRMSSIQNIDIASSSSAPAAVPSSFNPQNTAKVYSIPKTTLLSGGMDRDMRPKSILLLEDSKGDTVQVVNGGGSKTASPAQTPLPPTKPFRRASSGLQLEKDLKDLKDNLTATLPAANTPKTQTVVANTPKPQTVVANTPKTQTPPNAIPTPPKPAMTPPKSSPKLQKMQQQMQQNPTDPVPQGTSQVNVQEDSKEKPRQYSPLLTHKLHNLKANESPGTKEGVTSPLALLMAAKERDRRQRSTLSRENSNKSSRSDELPVKATIQPSESKPNSFTVIPKSTSSASLTSLEKLKPELSAQPGATVPQAQGQGTPSQVRKPVAKEESTPSVPPTATSSSPSIVNKKVGVTLENRPIPTPAPPPTRAPAAPAVPAPHPTPVPPAPAVPAPTVPIPPAPTVPVPSAPAVRVPTVPIPPAPTVPVPSAPAVKAPTVPIPPAPTVPVPPAPTVRAPPAPAVPAPPAPAAAVTAPAPPSPKDQESGEDLSIPFIPPPPEFANSDSEDAEGPPNTPPPDPPSKTVIPPIPPSPVAMPPKPPSKVPIPPPLPPPAKDPPSNAAPIAKPPPTAQKPKPPPTAPHLATVLGEMKVKMAQQTKPNPPSNLPTTPSSASQATLLSILQKKMLEMDPKLSVPVKEADNNTDEWGTTQSDEEGGIPTPPKPSPKAAAKSNTLPPPTRGLDLRELETRVAKKAAANEAAAAASKPPSSNGAAKQPFGMTFTVRPGTKQPITVVSKGES